MQLHPVSRTLDGTGVAEELTDDGEIGRRGRGSGGREEREREGEVLRDWRSGHSEEGRSDSLNEEDGDGGDVRSMVRDEPLWGLVAAEEMKDEVSEMLMEARRRQSRSAVSETREEKKARSEKEGGGGEERNR